MKILVGLAVYLPISALVGLWTDRNLDFFLTLLKGEVVNVPYWLSFLVTLFLNAVIVGLNLIAEVVRLLL